MFLSIDNAEKGPGPLSKHAREAEKAQQQTSNDAEHDVEANRNTAAEDENDAQSTSEKPDDFLSNEQSHNPHLASSTVNSEAGLPRNDTPAAA